MTRAGRVGAARAEVRASSGLPWLDLLAVGGVRVAAAISLWSLGFRAISDDDFSRVVIAARFAAQPMVDPSGTSWLPLPFWLTGTAMLVAGPSLTVARGLALLTAVAAALLLYPAARVLGVDRRGALIAGCLGAVLPYPTRLGIATVPDGYAAALITFAAATMAHEQPRWRAWGALAVTAAALCRYEAWPVAAMVAAFALLDARRRRSLALAASAALALVGPMAWLLNGALRHADPCFFLGRVVDYRAALGASAATPFAAVGSLLLALIRLEPELAVLVAFASANLIVARAPGDGARYGRFALGLGALFAFVVAADLRNAAPTHHGERAVLALWLGAAIVTGDGFTRGLARYRDSTRSSLGAAAGVLLLLATAGARPRWGAPDPFVDRNAEVAIGDTARELVPRGALLAVDTADYGFFAVIAAFGRPREAVALDERDPRRPRSPDAFTSPSTLRRRLDGLHARWLVTTATHAPVAAAIGDERAGAGRFVLFELTSAE
ncbi:MAG: glycosyltransferase family 39 protein [Polyangiaceae bacterium]|nr:glycosyltransferase family 39 protein [Polyangiaceae bacterium]